MDNRKEGMNSKKEAKIKEDIYKKDFLMKTIRAEEFGNVLNYFNFNTKSWRYTAYALTISENDREQAYKFRRKQRSKHRKKPFKITAKGIKKPGESLFTEEEKKGLSKQTSVTFVSPTSGYFPGPADIDKNGVRVGIAISPELAKVQRISLDDLNSYFYTYMHDSQEDAIAAANTFVSDLKEIINERETTRAHNEVMTRIRFDPDPRYYCQILFEENNIESRLVAQIRARDLTRRIRQQFRDMKRDLPHDYTVPIGYYIWEENNYKYGPYQINAQKEDFEKAIETSEQNSTASGLAQFLKLEEIEYNQKLDRSDFEKGIITPSQLKTIIKVASSLTWETGILFYKNFFLQNKDDILEQLRKNNQMNLLADIFNCVPMDKRQELIVKEVCNTAELRTHYLFSLMNLDHLEHDEAEIMRLLKDKDWEYDPNVKGPNSDSLYQYAIKHFLFDIADLLIKKHESLEEKSSQVIGQSLIAAIKQGEVDAAKKIIDKWPDILSYVDPKDGNTPLHWAVYFNDHEITQAIISNKKLFDELTNKMNRSGKNFYSEIASRIHQAFNQKRMTEVDAWLELINHFMVQNLPNTESGNLCRNLYELKNKFKIMDQGIYQLITTGQTPVTKAVLKNELNDLKRLIEAKANLNIPNKEGLTPIQLALKTVHVRKSAILAREKKNTMNMEKQASDLIIIAENNSVELIKVLVDAKAKLDISDKRSIEVAANIAAKNNNVEIIKIFAEAKASWDQNTLDDNTPLKKAIEHASVDVIELFIEMKMIDIESSKDIMAPYLNAQVELLYQSANELNIQKIHRILNFSEKYHINLDPRILFMAAKNGHSEIVKSLIEKKANIDRKNKDNDTVLLVSARNGYFDTMKYLLESKADTSLTNIKNKGLKECIMDGIHTSIKRNNYKQLKFLLNENILQDNKINFDEYVMAYFNTSNAHELLFEYAINHYNLKILNWLIQLTVDKTFIPSEKIATLFQKTLENNDSKIFAKFMQAMYSHAPNDKEIEHYLSQLLIINAKNGKLDHIINLYDTFSRQSFLKLINYKDKDKKTFLDHACDNMSIDIICWCMKNGIEFKPLPLNYKRLCILTEQEDYHELAMLVQNRKIDPIIATAYLKNYLNYSKLFEYVHNNQLDTLKEIRQIIPQPLFSKMINYLKDQEGNTALLIAAGKGHYEIVRWLIQNNADQTIANENDQGLKENLSLGICCIIEKSDYKTLGKIFSDYKTSELNLDMKVYPSFKTPKIKLKEVLRKHINDNQLDKLIEIKDAIPDSLFKEILNSKDSENNTLLLYAYADHVNKETIKWLILNGADPTHTNKLGYTCYEHVLDDAINKNDYEFTTKLLKMGSINKNQIHGSHENQLKLYYQLQTMMLRDDEKSARNITLRKLQFFILEEKSFEKSKEIVQAFIKLDDFIKALELNINNDDLSLATRQAYSNFLYKSTTEVYMKLIFCVRLILQDPESIRYKQPNLFTNQLSSRQLFELLIKKEKEQARDSKSINIVLPGRK